jgi:hypothetical protein
MLVVMTPMNKLMVMNAAIMAKNVKKYIAHTPWASGPFF